LTQHITSLTHLSPHQSDNMKFVNIILNINLALLLVMASADEHTLGRVESVRRDGRQDV